VCERERENDETWSGFDPTRPNWCFDYAPSVRRAGFTVAAAAQTRSLSSGLFWTAEQSVKGLARATENGR
jgi:hypothetical protein